MNRITAPLAAVIGLAASSAAYAGQSGGVLPGSGVIVGTPIILHNQLHFRQEAERLRIDYRAALKRGGGHLTPTDNAELFARYQSLLTRASRWIDEGDAPTPPIGSNIPMRNGVNRVGHAPLSVPIIPPPPATQTTLP